MSHILEHVPTTRSDAESRKIAKINAFLCATSEDVHCIVDKGSGMSLSRHGDVANAVKLSPRVCTRIICPDVVEPSYTIRSAETVRVSSRQLLSISY